MRIYRVEDPATGKGPYTGKRCEYCDECWQCRMDDVHSYERRDTHPTGNGDLIPYRLAHVKAAPFGFDSMRALFAWFGGYLRPMLADGFVVAVYECPDGGIEYGRSGRQLVFHLERSTRIK